MHSIPSSDKIKVLVVTPTLACGGAERFVSVLCNNINEKKLQLHLAVINNTTPFYKIQNPDITITDLAVNRVSRSFFKLKELIKKEKPDIVFTTANHLNLYVAMFKFLFSKKIIWVARESSVVSINAKFARLPGMYNFLLKTFYKNLDHIICQSSYMQHDLIQHYKIDKHKTSIIHNATDPGFKYYDGPVVKNSFLTVARLSPEKGIDRILQATSTLNIPFNYYIVGDGPEKQKLQALSRTLGIQDQVHFMGQQDKPFAGYEGCQAFLAGSVYDGFPNTVIEANAIGMPVVAMNAPGGITEIIADGYNGFLTSGETDFRNKTILATSFPFNRKDISESTTRKHAVHIMTASIAQLFLKLYSLQKK